MTQTEVAAFQSELKNKIQFKESSRISNDAVLFKAFKFFDLYNNGYLSKIDFFKAIAKCGVVVDTHNIDAIYRHYDPQNNGKIDYRAFIQRLLFNSSSQSQSEHLQKSQIQSQKQKQPQSQSQYQYQPPQPQPQQHQPQYSQSQNSPSDKLKQSRYAKQPASFEQALQIISTQLRGDGICGLLTLANQLKSTDFQRTHLITGQKISPFLRFLSEKAIGRVIANYQPNKFGQINYAELIYGIKGNMNLQRQALVDDLFNMLDADQRGEIEIGRLISSYRNRSEIGVFKRAIDLYCKFQSIEDGIFTDQDFNDFFQFVSFSFSSDLSFNEFIKIGFYSDQPPKSNISRSSRRQFQPKKQNSIRQPNKIPQPQPQPQPPTDFRKNKIEQMPKTATFTQQQFLPQNDQKRSHVSAQSRRSQQKSATHVQVPQVKQVNMIFLRMKKTLASKGTRGFLQFQKLLKANDTDNDGRVNIQQFKQVVKEQKIDITVIQALQIFGIFDQEKRGTIDYQQVIQTLKGQIPEMWDRVKVDEDHTTFSKLKSCLNFRNHPDIQTGRKYDDQIWNQIQQTILMIQDLSGSARSDTIYKQVFEEYCQNLSLSVSQDQLFETIAQTFWKIGSSVKIQQQYAGSRKVFDPSKSAYLQDHHRYAYNGGSVSQNAPFGTFNVPTSYKTTHQQL